MYLQYISRGVEGQMRTRSCQSSLELRHHVVMLNSHCSNLLKPAQTFFFVLPPTSNTHRPIVLNRRRSSHSHQPLRLSESLKRCGCSHHHPTASASSTLHY